MKIKKKIKNLLVFTIIFSSITTYSQGYDIDIKIFTGDSKADLPKIRSFFRTSDLLISRILPKKKCEKISYAVVLMNKKEFKNAKALITGKKGLRIYLPEDISKWEGNHEVFSNLIASAILKKSGTSNGENYKSIPKWLTSAIVKKILRRHNKHIIPGSISYPGVHALVIARKKIDWLSIISNPLPQEDGPAYQLFLESSEIILDGILRLPEGKQVLLDIIELSNKELKSEDLFKGSLIKKINKLQGSVKNDIFKNQTDPDIVKEWLNYIFSLSSVNVLNPCTASFAEKLFIDHQLVRYITKKKKGSKIPKEERYCKIEELPEKIKEIDDIQSVILKKQRDFLRIAFAMPIPLQNPVYKMEKSLKLILSKDYDEFIKIYNKQKIIFYDNLEKQHKLEVYILKTEKDLVPPGYRYNRELSLLNELKTQKGKRWPEFYEYLDNFSKNK